MRRRKMLCASVALVVGTALTSSAGAEERQRQKASPVDPTLTALNSEDPKQRSSAALEFADRESLTTAEQAALVMGLRDQSSEVRWNSAYALGEAGSNEARTIRALIESLGDADPQVMANAAQSLGKLGATQAITPLSGKLHSEAWQVRWASTLALGMIGSDAALAVPLITEALAKDGNELVRAASAKALGQIGAAARSSIDKLIDAAQSPHRALRATAIGALGGIGADTP
ncbi:MAG: HEAT repeat domain-containing protein [Planctomycetes bacterium]|nr:HEAT repeat domain-containing protein [Planctomycetota bacterium]